MPLASALEVGQSSERIAVVAAPKPAREARRSMALEELGILDTQPDTLLDSVTQLVRTQLGVSHCLISLVDRDRQWFKSVCGALSMKETSRDASFCAWAILGRDVMVVPDALNDPRFARNPLVLGEPHVRFYAGAPLVVDGSAVGALCVMNDSPRELEPKAEHLLKDCAQVVSEAMRLLRERFQAEKNLERRAHHDGLTGLANRYLLEDRFEQARRRAVRAGRPLALVSIDLDHFKQVNDTHGHAVGDAVLVHAAEVLSRAVRAGDTVARLGGDEFVVLFDGILDALQSAALEGRIRDAMTHQSCPAIGGPLRFSLGRSVETAGNADLEAMLKMADRSMYSEKHAVQ